MAEIIDRVLAWIADGLLRSAVESVRAAGQGYVPCLFHTLTGLYCPGCGGTRAAEALLRGDIISSILLHPLVPFLAICVPSLLAWYVYCRKKKKTFSQKIWKNVLWFSVFLITANFVVKNASLILSGQDILTAIAGK